MGSRTLGSLNSEWAVLQKSSPLASVVCIQTGLVACKLNIHTCKYGNILNSINSAARRGHTWLGARPGREKNCGKRISSALHCIENSHSRMRNDFGIEKY